MFTWETMSSLLNNHNNFLSVKEPVVIMNEIMSWLFKDIQLTVAWLNLTMPNQTVQNGLKAKKIKIKIFLIQTIISFIYLLAIFIVQNLKKFLLQIQSYEDAPFFDPKWSIWTQIIFFWKLLISFSSTY